VVGDAAAEPHRGFAVVVPGVPVRLGGDAMLQRGGEAVGSSIWWAVPEMLRGSWSHLHVAVRESHLAPHVCKAI